MMNDERHASDLHVPVLPDATLVALRPGPGMRFLDCTLGLGGHSAALLTAGATVLGIDRDPAARRLAVERLAVHGDRFAVRGGTFADVAEELVTTGEMFAGVLADLGVSSMQLEDANRGFSLRSESDADMRMGDGCEGSALDLIDQLDESALADIIYRFGEDRLSRRIARALKRERAAGGCRSGVELADVVRRAVPGHHPRHPAGRTFQALRIAVNDELGQLERLLAKLPELLQPGGIAVVISFHSLEDRLVKNSFREGKKAGRYSDAANRVTIASEAEEEANPRAASAKLRWARR